MLLVQAIRHAVDKINEHLIYREGLAADATSLAVETKLCDKIEERGLPPNRKLQTPEPLEYITLPTSWEILQRHFEQMQLPELQANDQRATRAKKNWDKFLLQSKYHFEKDLLNIFMHEPLGNKKELVLVRFKRQLLLLALYVENCFKSDAFSPVDINVDEWLMQQVNNSVTETEALLKTIMDDSIAKMPTGLGGMLSFAPQPRETELIVRTCKIALEGFHAFCKTADIARGVSKGDLKAMVDVRLEHTVAYKEQQGQPVGAMLVVHQGIVSYLILNLFEDAKVKACDKLKIIRPLYMQGHSHETADVKRQHLLVTLNALTGSIEGKAETDPEYWEVLFSTLTLQYQAGVPLGKGFANQYVPGYQAYIAHPQRMDEMFHKIHDRLRRAAPPVANTVVEKYKVLKL